MWNVRKKIENLKWRSTKPAHTLEKTKQNNNKKNVRNIDARNVFYVMQLCVSSKRDWFLEFSAPLLRYHLWSCVDCLLTPAAGHVAVSKFCSKCMRFTKLNEMPNENERNKWQNVRWMRTALNNYSNLLEYAMQSVWMMHFGVRFVSCIRYVFFSSSSFISFVLPIGNHTVINLSINLVQSFPFCLNLFVEFIYIFSFSSISAII